MLKRAVFFILTFFCLFSAVFASRIDFYVNNQPYKKPILLKRGKIYIQLHQILPVLGMKMVEKGRVFCAGWAYSKNLCPQETSQTFLFVAGKPVEKGVFMHHGTIWISVPELSSLLGFYYNYSSITDIGELTSPPNLAEIRAASSSSGSKSSKKTRKKSSQKEKPPVVARIVSYLPALITAQPPMYVVRTTFMVTNVSKKPVKGVTATLVFTRGTGKRAISSTLFHGGPLTYDIGTLSPGQTVTKMNRQITYTFIARSWTPRIKLDWQGKK